MFHKEGFKIILITLFAVIGISVIAHYFVDIPWLKKLIQIVAFLFLIAILQFFRNPKRITPKNDQHIIAPVDGKVVVIEEVFEKEYFKDKRLQVSIFMSPVNVHVTRYALGGKVTYSEYHPKASEENERTTIVVDNPVFGEVLYRQIAGALAKRIVNYAKVGETVVQGEDAGFIKFGSRVDVYLPLGTKINVQLNQTVKGGIDVIAEK